MKEWEGLKSGDRAVVRETIARAVSKLASVDVDDVLALGDLLVRLVAHDDIEVRRSLAAACEFLPDPMSSKTLEILAKDRAAHVRTTAERSLTRKAAAKKKRARAAERPETIETLLKEIGAKNTKARKQAERAVRLAEDAVASALHHELAKIHKALRSSFVEILAEATKPRPDLGAIARHAEDAKRRVEVQWSIIDAVRAYTSQVTPVFCEERLAELVEDARRTFIANLSREVASRVVFTADVPEHLTCEVDRGRMMQVLQNLFTNCKEAYGDEGPIEVRVEARATEGGRKVEISVADHGCGMDEAQIAEAFEPYRTNKPGGTGVGLPLVKRVVEEVHGGSVLLESSRGEGTTATMRLPSH
jgi:signal transduction histidine kinase